MDMNRYKKIGEVPGMVKDTVTNAILNTDKEALLAYKRQKAHLKNTAQLVERVAKTEDDISEIKDLLQQILGKLA